MSFVSRRLWLLTKACVME